MSRTTDDPERLDLRSHDVVEARRQELLRLFPEVRTEGGKIDFDRLKLVLGETVDVGKERYGMNWPGKADCFRAIQTPSLGTLRPVREESVDFDTTQNVIIEGDNLEVLKLLQKSYLGKVKMIYIDPPYNTGNDFIYPDDYRDGTRAYKEYTRQVDAEGQPFSSIMELSGRFHSRWLSMMYPRLYLARHLLREDGVMFMSIDDAEFDNARKLCAEIFGEENLAAVFVRRRRMATGMRDTPLSPDHEYVICVARNIDALKLYGAARREEDFPFEDAHGRYRSTDLTVGMTREMRPNQFYPIVNPSTGQSYLPPAERVWRFEPSTMTRHIEAGSIIWPDDAPASRMTRPRFKTRFGGDQDTGENPISTWIDPKPRSAEDEMDQIHQLVAGLNQEATKELRELLGEQILDYPKPVSLIRSLCATATRGNDIVLDFFAGSGTTGQAVLDLNHRDGGRRSFILVQLPQPTGRDDYSTIADITKERLRRAGKPFRAAISAQAGRRNDSDVGFRVFKLDESGFVPWNADEPITAEGLSAQLVLHVDHRRSGYTPEDFLYEVLIKSGLPLTIPIESTVIDGRSIAVAENGASVFVLEGNATLELVRGIAARTPQRVVFLDEAFAGNDQLKANAVQIFKSKGVTSFKTV